MTSFAALMALSATQTRQAEAQVQSALAERQRKEALKRKQQEEKDRKEKEMEAKLRLKILDEQRREQERQKKLEAERQAKEAALRKKEEEQRDALRYGPKKGKADYPSSSYASRDDVRRRKSSSSDDESGGGSALTREEKRRLRLQRELNYGSNSHKRPGAGGYRKAGRRLPGGAIDTIGDGGSSSGSYRSVKDRLAHDPPGLIKLNVNKRDTRTIDEIRQDLERKKSKVLSGEDAKGFDNWFGTSKAKAKETVQSQSQSQPSRASSIFSSRSPSPVEDKPAVAKVQSRSTKSLSRTPPAPSRPIQSSSSAVASASLTKSVPAPKGSGTTVRPMNNPLEKSFFNAGGKLNKAPVKPAPSLKAQGSSRVPPSSGKASASTSAPQRKRPRSRSWSESPPPAKKRSGSALPDNLSSEIWKLLARGNRDHYMSRPVDSDDDDMEADALDLEDEELYSAKLARKEDELAMEEERRHEEEKRRRKKEREIRERRG